MAAHTAGAVVSAIRLSTVATCHAEGCGWSAAGPGADKDAERHTRSTRHPTGVETKPVADEPARPPVPEPVQLAAQHLDAVLSAGPLRDDPSTVAAVRHLIRYVAGG